MSNFVRPGIRIFKIAFFTYCIIWFMRQLIDLVITCLFFRCLSFTIEGEFITITIKCKINYVWRKYLFYFFIYILTLQDPNIWKSIFLSSESSEHTAHLIHSIDWSKTFNDWAIILCLSIFLDCYIWISSFELNFLFEL